MVQLDPIIVLWSNQLLKVDPEQSELLVYAQQSEPRLGEDVGVLDTIEAVLVWIKILQITIEVQY